MITISLNQIKSHDPCPDGWDKILKAKGHLGHDEQWPLVDALESNSLNDVVWALRCVRGGKRIAQEFALWCAEQVRHLMRDSRSLNALDVTRKYLDANASLDDLDNARISAAAVYGAYGAYAAVYAAYAASPDAAADAVYAADAAYAAYAVYAADAAADAYAADADAKTCMSDRQKEKLREMLRGRLTW